jgi:3-oxoacyl-[acyl-carrier protein] reductase
MGALAGRAAVVTGAASGIGAAIAEAYAAEGAALLLADRDPAGLEAVAGRCRDAGAKAVTHPVDVTSDASCRYMIERTVSEFGAVHVLVSCAGILTEVPFARMDVATWDEMIATDLRSVFLCCRWAVPHMVRQRWGRVINIASQLGIKGGESLVHYSAAKAGVIGLTRALAREVAAGNVLVNAIAPGPIDTPLTAGISDEWRAAKQAELPLRRFGVPREVAPTAVLLASDPGGNLYVGQTLGPNSGDVMP